MTCCIFFHRKAYARAKEIIQEDAKILEYWYDNSLFSDWKKPPRRFTPDNSLIRDDIAFYRDKGIPYISSFACYLGKDYEALYGEPDLSAFSR